MAQKRPPEKKFKINASLYLMNFDYLSYESNLLILGHPHICDRGGGGRGLSLYTVFRPEVYIYYRLYLQFPSLHIFLKNVSIISIAKSWFILEKPFCWMKRKKATKSYFYKMYIECIWGGKSYRFYLFSFIISFSTKTCEQTDFRFLCRFSFSKKIKCKQWQKIWTDRNDNYTYM